MSFKIERIKKVPKERVDYDKAIEMYDKHNDWEIVKNYFRLRSHELEKIRDQYLIKQIQKGIPAYLIARDNAISYRLLLKKRQLYIARQLFNGVSEYELTDQLNMKVKEIENDCYYYVKGKLKHKTMIPEFIREMTKLMRCKKSNILESYIVGALKEEKSIHEISKVLRMEEDKIVKIRKKYVKKKIERGFPISTVHDELQKDLEKAPGFRETCIIYELKKNHNQAHLYLQKDNPIEISLNNKNEEFILKKFGVSIEELRVLLFNYIERERKKGKQLTLIAKEFGFAVNEQGKFVYDERIKKDINPPNKVAGTSTMGILQHVERQKRPSVIVSEYCSLQPISKKRRLEAITEKAQQRSQDSIMLALKEGCQSPQKLTGGEDFYFKRMTENER
jgi:hypothetical protein